MRIGKSNYVDERDKLIPAAVARTEQECRFKAEDYGDTVPVQHAPAFLRHMDDLARENWLLSRRGIEVDTAALRMFLSLHGILPTRAGKIVVNCGMGSVGSVDFVGGA